MFKTECIQYNIGDSIEVLAIEDNFPLTDSI